MLNKLNKLSENRLIFFLTAMAMLIACRVMFIQHGWINDDSTLYFEIAKRFSAGKWREGWELFQWPFYPLLITLVHKLTNLGLYQSAQILAVIFYGITAFSLSKIIQLAGGDKIAILFGNLLLFSSTYITGDVFAMLLRDQGFWAFLLASLVFFIRYAQKHRLQDALSWQACIIAATLFRIEAIGYALILPCYLLLQPGHFKNNFRHLLTANIVHICLVLCAAAYLFFVHSQPLDIGRLAEVKGLFSEESGKSFYGELLRKSHIFAEQVLGGYLEDYAKFGLIVTLVGVVVVKCFKVAGVHCSILILSARQQLLNISSLDVRNILLLASSIAVLNAIIIIFRSFVLSSRYVIAFGFIIIILAAIYLASLAYTASQQRQPRWKQALLVLIAVLVILGLGKNLSSKRADHNYEQQAVAWVQANHPNDRIFYGSSRLRFYANVPWAGRGDDVDPTAFLNQLEMNATPSYDCLVMRAEADKKDTLAKLTSLKQYQEVNRFSNKAGNHILVLCRRKTN